MTTVLLVVHILVSFFLIFIVLLQSGGKGAELGAAFGGSSQTLFGSRGAATFFSKLTTVAAIVFMLTSLSLAVVSSKTESIIKRTEPVKEKGGSLPAQGPVQGGEAKPAQQQTPQSPLQPQTK